MEEDGVDLLVTHDEFFHDFLADVRNMEGATFGLYGYVQEMGRGPPLNVGHMCLLLKTPGFLQLMDVACAAGLNAGASHSTMDGKTVHSKGRERYSFTALSFCGGLQTVADRGGFQIDSENVCLGLVEPITKFPHSNLGVYNIADLAAFLTASRPVFHQGHYTAQWIGDYSQYADALFTAAYAYQAAALGPLWQALSETERREHALQVLCSKQEHLTLGGSTTMDESLWVGATTHGTHHVRHVERGYDFIERLCRPLPLVCTIVEAMYEGAAIDYPLRITSAPVFVRTGMRNSSDDIARMRCCIPHPPAPISHPPPTA